MKPPKEKAKELYDKFLQFVLAEESMEHDYAKRCALICVEELIRDLDLSHSKTVDTYLEQRSFWVKVRQEIEKL